MKPDRRILPMILLALALTACGGGGGGGASSSSPTSAPPPLTLTTGEGFRVVESDCPVTQTLGEPRGDAMRIAQVRWLQTVQLDHDHHDTRLVANKSAKLRVDLLASGSPLSPATMRLRVHDPASGQCTDIALSGPSRVPGTVDEAFLGNAFVATLPAELVKPGLSVTLVFDDAEGRSAAEADLTYRVLWPDIAPAVIETLRVIPVRLLSQNGYFTPSSALGPLLERLYPVSQVNVVQESPFEVSAGLLGTLTTLLGGTYVGTPGQMQTLLALLDDHCSSLNGNARNARTAPKCLALLPDNLIFRPSGSNSQIVGLAYVGGITMLARSVSQVDNLSVSSPYASSHWISFDAMTVAHEYGHLLNLDHANCGSPSMLDSRLYPDGRLGGGGGWDAVRNVYFSSQRLSAGQPQFADVMSYCGKEWPSDRGYLASMAYRVGSGLISARESEPEERWLRVMLTPSGWQAREVAFAPATLRPASVDAEFDDEPGRLHSLQSAVVSEHDQVDNFGPFYMRLDQQRAEQVQLRSRGMLLARVPVHARDRTPFRRP